MSNRIAGYNPSVNSQKKKIYIGNISYEIDTPELQEAFSRYGEIIDAVVIKDRETSKSRGFGFVTFNDSDSALSAVEEMHGSELAGRELRVKLAEAKRRDANEAPRHDSYFNSTAVEPRHNANEAVYQHDEYFNPSFYQKG